MVLCEIQLWSNLAKKHVWYDRNWNPVLDQMNLAYGCGHFKNPPVNLSKIIFWGETLSRAYSYPFVRVDLYNGQSGVCFGEFTHAPFAGPSRKLYTSYANRTLGKLWTSAESNLIHHLRLVRPNH